MQAKFFFRNPGAEVNFFVSVTAAFYKAQFMGIFRRFNGNFFEALENSITPRELPIATN